MTNWMNQKNDVWLLCSETGSSESCTLFTKFKVHTWNAAQQLQGILSPLPGRGSPPLYFPFPSPFFPFPFLSSSFPVLCPFAAARSLEERSSYLRGSWQSLATESILIHFSYKLSHLAKLQLLMMMLAFIYCTIEILKHEFRNIPSPAAMVVVKLPPQCKKQRQFPP